MLTFRTPPSDDHLFSVFTNRTKHIPGLATTMAHLKRIPYGRVDKNIQFLMDACLALVEEIRTDRQLAEVAKVYKNGGTDVALVMGREEEGPLRRHPRRQAVHRWEFVPVQSRHQDHRGGQGES